MNQQRFAELQKLQQTHGLDFVALVPGPNFYYFTGLHMHLSERPIVALLPRDNTPPILIAPQFEADKCVQLGTWHVFSYCDGELFQPAFKRAVQAARLNQAQVGFEPTHMRVLEWSLLTEAAPEARWVSAAEIIAQLRSVKHTAELEAMRAAVRCAEQALEQTLPRLRVGMTERAVANLLITQLYMCGAEGMPFPPLVQSGPNSALPHATPSDRVLQANELLLLDFGATVKGYHSDITRTFALGEIGPELRHVYEVVKQANATALAKAAPGISCEEVDSAARSVITAAGLGERFIHRTGHGLGLEGHEPPYLVAGNITPLRVGMTFTIEPGVYLPDLGGVRIEDDVVITPDGCESLTHFPRDLISLPV